MKVTLALMAAVAAAQSSMTSSMMPSGTMSASMGRPSNTSICDYYTTALLMNNTATNQYTLLQLLVNTAVIGNYTMPNVGVTVPGILADGMVNGTAVSLLQYFNGSIDSTNNGGKPGKMNFLDGGGATPLMNNSLPTHGSNEYTLMTHLYEYFGDLLGCTMQGNSAFSAYKGSDSMSSVHQFMNLSYAEVTYFIDQVAMSGASFGVAASDLTAVGTALNGLFNVRCAPAMAYPPGSKPASQSICQEEDCPLAPMAMCMNTNGGQHNTTASGSSSGSGSSSMSSSGSMSSGMMSGASGSASAAAASSSVMATMSSGSGIAQATNAASKANVGGVAVLAAALALL